jgi:hypothetical protein
MTDREFWIQIRRGLIVMLDAIDVRFALNTVRPSAPASPPSRATTPESPTSQERISANGIRNR